MASFLEALGGFGRSLQPLAQQQQSQQDMTNMFKIAQNPEFAQSLGYLMNGGGRNQTPSAIQEYNFLQSLTPDQKKEWFQNKRGDMSLNLGNKILVRNPDGTVSESYQVGVNPNNDPSLKAAQTTAQLQARTALEPNLNAQNTMATEGAKVDVDKEKNYSKAKSSINSFEQQVNLVTDNIDKALSTIGPLSTGYGSYLSGVPNSDARKLKNYLDTIKANVGFDKLQNMRDNSPTGGALGQVSENENKLLQAVNGALDPGQSDQLVENLQVIKQLYPQVLAEKKSAFQHDYGDLEASKNQDIQSFPVMSAPQMGSLPPAMGTPGFNPAAPPPITATVQNMVNKPASIRYDAQGKRIQ